MLQVHAKVAACKNLNAGVRGFKKRAQGGKAYMWNQKEVGDGFLK